MLQFSEFLYNILSLMMKIQFISVEQYYSLKLGIKLRQFNVYS